MAMSKTYYCHDCKPLKSEVIGAISAKSNVCAKCGVKFRVMCHIGGPPRVINHKGKSVKVWPGDKAFEVCYGRKYVVVLADNIFRAKMMGVREFDVEVDRLRVVRLTK